MNKLIKFFRILSYVNTAGLILSYALPSLLAYYLKELDSSRLSFFWAAGFIIAFVLGYLPIVLLDKNLYEESQKAIGELVMFFTPFLILIVSVVIIWGIGRNAYEQIIPYKNRIYLQLENG